jgi:hypothetical protein
MVRQVELVCGTSRFVVTKDVGLDKLDLFRNKPDVVKKGS